MPSNRINFIIGASSLACILLILFQVQWMRQSRRLIEENFQQKVNMALCSAVNRLAEDGGGCTMNASSGRGEIKAFPGIREDLLDRELREAMAFYQIAQPFTLRIVSRDSLARQDPPPFHCSLEPLIAGDSHLLQVDFPNKIGFLMRRMGFVIASSIFILLFITFVFALASLGLYRQRRITRQNVDFFNNMAHEFRTPLTNIGLAARMLGRKHPDLAGHPMLDIINRESRQLARQLEGILHLSRLENAAAPPLDREPVDLSRLIGEVTATMEPLIREKNAEVTIHGPNPCPAVAGDPFHLGNAFRNLLDNSLKYCRERPVIRIDIADAGPCVRVQVQDNGIGISPGDQAFVFEKFQRVGTGNLHREKGFGIGLAYVKSIVERHRGHIRLASEPDRGTRFELELPKN